MIREPVDRIVSQFHYLRSTKRWGSKPSPPRDWFRKDFSSCVKSGDLECQVRDRLEIFVHHFKIQIGGGGQDMQLTYFCGSHIQCANASNPLALQVTPK